MKDHINTHMKVTDLVMFAVEMKLVLSDGHQPDSMSEARGRCSPRVNMHLTSCHLPVNHLLLISVTDIQTHHDLSQTPPPVHHHHLGHFNRRFPGGHGFSRRIIRESGTNSHGPDILPVIQLTASKHRSQSVESH